MEKIDAFSVLATHSHDGVTFFFFCSIIFCFSGLWMEENKPAVCHLGTVIVGKWINLHGGRCMYFCPQKIKIQPS